ncbi:uncharacterized protein LOC119068405 [Bradysia coprophila]|uniref:uncharacterized protein LOC119068405 n=1 Tax=Bradysia coprophila TaxID=38358 RepID=UPI00187DA71E|nr:uncharacterized protein LOC119068405 [Bradysia coprophila]
MDIELQAIDKPTTTDHQDESMHGNLTWCERIKSFLLGRFKITSISMTFLLMWLLFETLLCIIVLNCGTHNYIENFINYICDSEKCPSLLTDLLYWRILVSSVSIVGILVGNSSLVLIWVLMNALGLSPLFPVLFSCFYKYKALNSKLDNASVLWKIIQFIYKCLMSA